ncbi:precorrin-6y C5,15-methyltransferase (decarboxylating) subunit CbiE [uncultured Ezakiella sp.]|uniref:precorrin-6y C5,15-methyltransferase (decarboxylating) subunit CbiE n=1 Tax=uncultured Ezakiella sp. TaxID=1637529 RepID=UPI0025CF5E67|nr:precorrin-6y C5,15-methyltransferase (decarboxylating) subunit CbiE [uncultured Ezakiella sp.]
MIDVAGVGPGNINLITGQVLEAIKTYEKVLAFKRVKESLSHIRPDIIEIKTLKEVDAYKEANALVLASGDPMFYGISEYIKKMGVLGKIYPGISSIQCMAAAIKKSWHDMDLVSLHGRDYDLKNINRDTIFLTDKEMTPNRISQELFKLGKRGKVFAGYNLSYEDELIEEFDLGETGQEPSPLAVCVVVLCEQ